MEILLKELTHRVKNSLQTIGSIVRIEARHHRSGEGRGALEQVANRINAIGRLYANLEKAGSIEAIDAALYLEDVCANLIASTQQAGETISLVTDVANEQLPTAQAIPIGLIVNELVTNAIKYAFPEGGTGTVTVTLKRISGRLCLSVADDGIGASFQRHESGLGSLLIEGFAEQLDARLERRAAKRVRPCV